MTFGRNAVKATLPSLVGSGHQAPSNEVSVSCANSSRFNWFATSAGSLDEIGS